MPLTPAEKQKKYREKLKANNPEKYEEMKKKAAENALKYYRNKRDNYTEDQKEEQRRKWKEDRKKAKEQMPSTSQQKTIDKESVDLRNIQRRIEYKFQQENMRLRKDLISLSRRFKNLQKSLYRHKKQIDETNENLKNVMIRLKQLENSKTSTESEEVSVMRQNTAEYTPRKRVEEFISENIPHIETPKKEVIKQKLLEHNVLTEALKLEMKSSNQTEKRTFKKILNNNLVEKYRQKTKLTLSLGFKGSLKKYTRAQIRKAIQLRNKIEDFFNRDDVTRATAGKKEYRTYKKVTRQIRYQLDKLKILHQKYTAEVEKISFSTFKKYRPFYVLPPKIRNCETCACVKHSNMQFLVDALKSQGFLQEKESLNDITSDFVCDFKTKECMFGECHICADRKLFGCDDQEEIEVTWFEWAMKEHAYGQGDKVKQIKRMMKTTKEGTLKDLLHKFNTEMTKFKIHAYNFYHQFNKYKDCKENLKNNEAIIHIDFSENFTCKYNKEVQAMHFIKDQITLHTGVLYVTNERPISFCSISPNNEHCPEAIWAHLDPILKYIKAGYPNVSILHFFSDGPTTQYRQKKNFFLFSKNIYEYGFESGTWSFFESAHGKGAADGIGGAIKRNLDAKIAQGIDIPNAETAFNILNMSDTGIKIFFIPMDNIKPLDISILPIPGTMKIHQLMTNSVLKVKYRNLSCFCNDLNGMCECYSPMIHEFKTATGQDTSKTQTKGKKRKTSEKENVDYREKTKRTRKYRKVSSSSENSTDMDIEYADSDVTCYMEEDTLDNDEDNLDNVEVDLIERKEDNEEQANTFDLDEKTGFLKQRIDPNKKINVLSTRIIMKAKSENNDQSNNDADKIKEIESKRSENKTKDDKNKSKVDRKRAREERNKAEEDKSKVGYRNKKVTHVNVDVNVKQHILENNYVTILSQIRNAPENIASYDLGESNIFGKTGTMTELKSTYSDTNKTENREKNETDFTKNDMENILEDKSDNKELNIAQKEEIERRKHAEEDEAGENIQIEEREEDEIGEIMQTQEREEDGSGENMQTDLFFNINDAIIVRYYLRKTWKHYIGVVESIVFKDGLNYYQVKFLKTIKDSFNSLKFTFQRKLDIDIVNNNNIVKKVNLVQKELSSSKEYYLEDDRDLVFFT